MASDLEKIGLEALLLMDQWSKGVGQYVDDLKKMEGETEKTAKQTAKETEKMAAQQERALQQVGLAFSAAGAAAGVLLTSIAMTASRTEELGVILDVTATNARRMAEANGDYATAASLSADAVHAQVAAVKELGITTQVSSQLVAQMIRYNLDWQKATDLARLAQDAATFAAQDSSQALQGLIHGITTLNPRVLRTYGILVNLDQEYQKWADANNRVSTSLTSTEKQAIALNAALAQAPNIAGAYEAAMDTASKQIRSLSRDTTEVAEAFGEHLTPALNAGVGALRDLLKWMRDLPDPIQSTAVQLGVAAAALSSFLGAAALVIPKIISLAGAIKNLALVQNLAAAGMLGPAGLVAGLVAASAALLIYARNVEKARREEAAGIQDASESYEQYLELLDEAELGSYALSEGLWEIANSANAAADGLDALALTEAFRELQQGFGFDVTGIEWLDDLLESLPRLTADMDQLSRVTLARADAFSEATLAVMADVDAMERLGLIQGYTGDTLDDFVKTMTNAAAVIKATRDAADGTGHSMIGLGGAMGTVAQEAQSARVHLAAVNMVMGDLEGATEESAEALREYYRVLAEYGEQSQEAVEDAAERMVEAEDKAAERRQRARQQLLDAQEDLERDHAKTVAGILEDLADVDIDLNEDLLQAEQDYQRRRSELATEYQDEILDAERDLARDQEQVRLDTLRRLEDLQREYEQDVADAKRELDEDLLGIEVEYRENRAELAEEHAEDLLKIETKYQQDRVELAEEHAEELQELEADLAADNAATWESYYSRMESLAEKHNQTLASITEKYARQRASIEEKYRTEPTRQEEIDAERERILRELEQIGDWPRGYMERQQQAELLALLDALLQEELAMLEAAEQEEIAAAEAAYQEQQALEAQRRDEELAANQEHYDTEAEQQRLAYERELEELRQAQENEIAERQAAYETRLEDLKQAQENEIAERQAAYEKELEDLVRSREREREEIQINQQRRFADLQAAHEAERQEIARRYQERLVALGRQLQEEKTRLEQAAAEEQARLQEQLEDERQNYAERQQELRDHYAEQIEEVKSSLAEEQEKIKQGLAEELREITDRMGDQSRAFRDAYSEQLRDLEHYLWERLQRERQYQWELQNLWGIHSASKWMTDFGKDLSAGLEVGLEPSLSTSLGDALGAFQSSLGSLGAGQIQPAAMPYPVAQPSMSSSETINLEFQANYARQQSEASLRDDVSLIMMQLRSMQRGRR